MYIYIQVPGNTLRAVFDGLFERAARDAFALVTAVYRARPGIQFSILRPVMMGFENIFVFAVYGACDVIHFYGGDPISRAACVGH